MLNSNIAEFFIKDFVYDGTLYPMVNALDKVKEVNDYVQQTAEAILTIALASAFEGNR